MPLWRGLHKVPVAWGSESPQAGGDIHVLGGWCTPAPQEQKLLCSGPSPGVALHLAALLRPLSCPQHTSKWKEVFLWVCWAPLANEPNPRRELEPPSQSWSVRSTLACNWHLKWVCVVCRAACGAEPLPCGIQCYLRADSVSTELDCRMPSGCHRALCVQHTGWPEVSEVKWEVREAHGKETQDG